MVMYADFDTENGHDKVRWVHLRSVRTYSVKRLLMYPSAFRSTTSGIGTFLFEQLPLFVNWNDSQTLGHEMSSEIHYNRKKEP